MKGIKRQIAVDADGLPLCIDITTANVHDSKGTTLLLKDLHELYPSVSLVKADKGYRGTLTPKEVVIECVKSGNGLFRFNNNGAEILALFKSSQDATLLA